MLRIALKMLVGDRAKYLGLLLGITFTSFLVTFAACYFCGIMTYGFSLISENPAADIWVMEPAVESVEQTTNLPASALDRVRGVQGVRLALPLVLCTVEARFANGKFQSVQVVGVDDATLAGAPSIDGNTPTALRRPDAAIADEGGTTGKLDTPQLESDQWSHGKAHLTAPTRPLTSGDELMVNDHRIYIVGRSDVLPRFPPRPLLYMTYSNALRILPIERLRLTFVLVTADSSIPPSELATRIESQTGLRARTAADFKADTVRWYLVNSEDVGDVATMLTIAMLVGLGVTAVMLYMFTNENLRQYGVLRAMGASRRLLLMMVFAQAGLCAIVGTGIGLGLCAIASQLAAMEGFPFRMMWFTPIFGTLMVLLVSAVSATISARPVLTLHPAEVFSGR